MTPPELIPQGVPLSEAPGFTEAQVKTLADAWIGTAQEFVALAKTPQPTRDLLVSALGVDQAELAHLVQAAQDVIPPTRDVRSVRLELEAAAVDYGLGALLDEPPEVLAGRLALPAYEPPGGRFVLPASVSHLDVLPPVRNQGSRGTCVAHAVLSVREQLEMTAGSSADIDLSEQFIYWWCKEHDGIPTVSGTYVAVGMRCLEELGAPLEDTWRYVSYERGDQGQGPPPPAAENGDPGLKTLRTLPLNRTDITGIKTCIAEGRVVAFSIPVFDSWYDSAATRRWGKITPPLPRERPDGGHAMALVGYQDDPAAPGGGYFLVRNSWQPWSYDGVWQEGYGYIPYAYISQHATAVFSADRLVGADLALRDSAADTGARPAASLAWNSPDIWLRRAADGGATHQAAVAGQPNALYGRVRNSGPAYAYDVRLELFAAPLAPYIQPTDWQSIARKRVDGLAPGEHIVGPLIWTPAAAGPYAYQARLSSAEDPLPAQPDPATTNNVASRHSWPVDLAPGASANVTFPVVGAAASLGLASLQVDRAGLPPEVSVSALKLEQIPWGAPGAPPTRGPVDEALLDAAVHGALTGGMILGAGQRYRASLTITLPPGAQPGARHTLVISQLQGETVVGSLTVEVNVVG